MPRVIVVGAGTSGCIVASRLTESDAYEVDLLESGPDTSVSSSTGLRSLNWLNALGEQSAFYPNVFARKLEGSEPKLYLRGRGVGGSASVNAMLALPGLPQDYDRWAEVFGCDQWDWNHVEPWFAELKNDLVTTDDSQLTPVDRALLDAAKEIGLPAEVDTYTPSNGSGKLWRNANAQGRHSSRERYLDPVRSRENLTVRPDSPVDKLIIDSGRILGVVLADGTEMHADEVVLCAGAFETPAILLRSGLRHPGIGKNLQDHPAASVYFSLRPEYREINLQQPCISSVLRLSSSLGEGDIHLLPVHGTLLETVPYNHGLVMAGLMKVTSVGEVTLDPNAPLGPPVINERMLSTDEDRQAMKEALVALARVLNTDSFRRIVEDVFIDERGTPLSALEDDAYFETWLSAYVGDYFHACGTARMGTADDLMAVVDQTGRVLGFENLRIADASVMPEVPSANTHLPTAMIAERISSMLIADLQHTGATG